MAEELKPHHYWREDRITGRLVVITPDEYEQWGKDNQPSEAYRPAFTRAQLPSQGGEAVEVVAYRGKDPDGGEGFVGARWPDAFGEDCIVEPLMTVAQHNRTVEALTAPTCKDGLPVAQGEALKQRFDELEFEVAQGKHTAASIFTQMRTAALYINPPSPDAELVGLMRDASVAMSSAHESLFKQCLSNGITNAWGNPVDVSKVNDLQLAAKRIDAALSAKP